LAYILAIANQKGGVGKTTTAVNVASFLAADGYRVLMVDFDPQANATRSLGVETRPQDPSIYDALIGHIPAVSALVPAERSGLDVLPASGALAGAEIELVDMLQREQGLAKCIEPLRANYDFIVIDCPPALGLLTVNALCAAESVIIPVQCEYLALDGLVRLRDTVSRVRSQLNRRLTVAGVVMTMFDIRTRLSLEVVKEVARYFPGLVFHSVIPRNVKLSEAPSYGQSILDYDAACKGAQAYRALVDELKCRLLGVEEVGLKPA
jgi:chromosome partitioning protein